MENISEAFKYGTKLAYLCRPGYRGRIYLIKPDNLDSQDYREYTIKCQDICVRECLRSRNFNCSEIQILSGTAMLDSFRKAIDKEIKLSDTPCSRKMKVIKYWD